MGLGRVMKVQHPATIGGSFVPGAGKSLALRDATLVGDAVATFNIPQGYKIATVGSPFTVLVKGVTGANAADLNGSRTFTRTGDKTCTTGVVGTAKVWVFPIDGSCFITGIPLEAVDANVPNQTIYDWDE